MPFQFHINIFLVISFYNKSPNYSKLNYKWFCWSIRPPCNLCDFLVNFFS